MELQDYRQQIDQIDAQLTELFQQRMQVLPASPTIKRHTTCPFTIPPGNAPN